MHLALIAAFLAAALIPIALARAFNVEFHLGGRGYRIGAALVMAAIASVFFVNVAAAAGTVDTGDTIGSLELSSVTVTLLISLVIPIVVGTVTKFSTSAFWKGFITLVLNLLNGAIVQATVADGSAFWSQESLIAALVGMAISVTSYLGIYRRIGEENGGINALLAPSKGL